MTEKIKEIVESKITVGSGIILSLIVGIILTGASVLFNHSSRIAVAEASILSNYKLIQGLASVPEKLGRIEEQLKYIQDMQVVHKNVSFDNNKRLKEKRVE